MSRQTRGHVQCFICHSYHVSISTICVTLHVNELTLCREAEGMVVELELGERAAERVTGVQDCISATTGYLTFGQHPAFVVTKSGILSQIKIFS